MRNESDPIWKSEIALKYYSKILKFWKSNTIIQKVNIQYQPNPVYLTYMCTKELETIPRRRVEQYFSGKHDEVHMYFLSDFESANHISPIVIHQREGF